MPSLQSHKEPHLIIFHFKNKITQGTRSSGWK
jgi:hypothetical protein